MLKRCGIGSAAVFAGSLLMSLSSLHAETIVVPLGGDIQEAIESAVPGDIVQLEAGVYAPKATLTTKGKAITLLGSTDQTGAPVSWIDGANVIRVLRCSDGETTDTVFENLVIANGFDPSDGGGMYTLNSSPTMINCIFRDNSAQYVGGAIFNINSNPTYSACSFIENTTYGQLSRGGAMGNRASNPVLTDCVFRSNGANGAGGGMHNDESAPSIVNTEFVQNKVAYLYGNGGAIYAEQSDVDVRDCVFEANTAAYGGAIHSTEETSVRVLNSLFMRNSSNEFGGAMYNRFSEVFVSDCTFDRNASTLHGGAMQNIFGTPLIENCLFVGQYAAFGAAMNNVYCSPTLDNCLFIENKTVSGFGFGGGLYNSDSSPLIQDCAFERNGANFGGGMFSTGTASPILVRTIVCGNVVDQIVGSYVDQGGNAITEDCVAGFYGACDGDLEGDGVVDGRDLSVLLSGWGSAGPRGDIDQNGVINGQDLAILLGGWGRCF